MPVGSTQLCTTPARHAPHGVAGQVVVLDKLDYCASTHNFNTIAHLPNFKVRVHHIM
jgi:hypothetical protein